jgi:flagellar assembly protein FliH
MTEPRRFVFETVFDGEGEVIASAAPRKVFFSAAEIEQARSVAHADGRREALAEAEAEQARALAEISQALSQALGVLAQTAHGHCAHAAELAMAAARKIADAALERFPEAPAEAALKALLIEIEAHPRLLVRAAEAVAERVQAALDRTAEAAGYPGQVTVRSDPALAGAAFVFEWGEGRAAFDPDQAAARVAAALEAALAAEGLHGEPLIPVQGSSDV